MSQSLLPLPCMSEEVFSLLYTHSVSNMLVFPNQFYIKYQYYNKQFPYLQSQVAAETSGQTKHCEGNEFLPLEREAPPCHLLGCFPPQYHCHFKGNYEEKFPTPTSWPPNHCFFHHLAALDISLPLSRSGSDLSPVASLRPARQRSSNMPELALPGSLAPAEIFTQWDKGPLSLMRGFAP